MVKRDKVMSEVGKQNVAKRALEFVLDEEVIGVGTGSTVDVFLAELANAPHRLKGAVATSSRTREQLKAMHIPVLSLNATGTLPVYIDGADEVNQWGYCIKGGGGALTQEKIVASASEQFVCIVTKSKVVLNLGEFPLAIEVLEIARSFVGRKVLAMGGDPVYREGFKTDNGHIILDVFGFDLTDSVRIAKELNNIPGVVAHGLFVEQRADVILVGSDEGVEVLHPVMA